MRFNTIYPLFFVALGVACGSSTSSIGESTSEVAAGTECSKAGAQRPADDGCNSCTCADGVWQCTEMACDNPGSGGGVADGGSSGGDTATGGSDGGDAECPVAEDTGDICTQNVTWGKNPSTGDCCQYGTPCDVPEGWSQFASAEACESPASVCPAPTALKVCTQVVAWAKDPDSGTCCYYNVECQAPEEWEHFGTAEACDGPIACGGFMGDTCAEDEYCKYSSCNGPAVDAMGVCETKPNACPRKLDPVCGCDGETYDNSCQAAAAGVSVEDEGACVTR